MDDALRGLEGWFEESTDEVSLRMVYEQSGGGRLVAETGRPARAGLWLWVLDRPEARAFLLEADDVGPALQVLQEHRDSLVVSSYFGGYGALQQVAKVSILAYEQFAGVTPPFPGIPSVPPPAGGSGWGNSSGNKSW
ncbi:MAG: hypothetical protein JJ863_17220 [Deltaproteobacteria bacterium]|nr:hypothetical protein [Deltaproteobacteria bacterium]